MSRTPREILVKLTVADIMNPDNNKSNEGWDPRLVLAASESPTGSTPISLEHLLAISMIPQAVEIILKPLSITQRGRGEL